MNEEQLNPDEWRLINQDFHFMMYEAARMPRLQGVIAGLWVAVASYLRLYVNSLDSFRVAQQQHRALIDCIRAGDAEGAEAVLRDLEVTLEVLLQQFPIAEDSDERADAEGAASPGNIF